MSVVLYGLVGAGGFGREVMPLLRDQLERQLAASEAELVFVVDDEYSTAAVNGVRVVHMSDFLGRSCPRFFNIAIADGRARERIADQCIAAGARPITIKAGSAAVLDNCTIGEGAILCPFSIVTSNVVVGRFFHANLYSYVAHDGVVGDFVTLAPKASCNGRVHIENHAYIGTGAVLREGAPNAPLVIGRGAVVGMGAVVTRSVAPGETVIGSPARPMGDPRR